MSRRRQGDGDEHERESPAPEPFHTPFRRLETLRASLPPAVVEPAARPRPAPSPLLSEDDLFRDAVKGVLPIRSEERNQVGGRAPLPPAVTPLERERAEALAELTGLVSGAVRFDLSDGDEHVEGMVAGLDLRILRRLRAGEFAYQSHLDLHGMIAEEAKGAVREFVLGAVRDGKRCVLVIHGRGLKSRDRRPVLKDALKQWLTRGEVGRVVLAFSTARACDGGSGAMYVLLRRERRAKKPFLTLQGAKA